MSINSISPVSFKGYVPVKYMAVDPINGESLPIVDRDNIRKCQGFIVRNLNGTAKNNRNDEFVSLYKSHDPDYARYQKVTSVYDKNSPEVYMVTGADTDVIDQYAKPVGQAKGYALERTGYARSFESRNAANTYFRQVKAYLRNSCRQLKDAEGNKLSLVVSFVPKYNKKNELKGFEYSSAEFVK